MKKNKIFRNTTQAFFAFDEKTRKLLGKSRLTLPLYTNVILPLETAIYGLGDYKFSPAFKKGFEESKKLYLKGIKDPVLLKKIEKNLLKAHITLRLNNDEYFIYDLYHQNYEQWQEWLTDRERYNAMMEKYGEAVFDELRNKEFFYNITKRFFHRDVCFIGNSYSEDLFIQFTKAHPRFIVKPIKGSLGADTFITSVKDETEAKKIYHELQTKGVWIAEELIKQHESTAAWNESSVNTVRIPSFRLKDGCHILQPFFRTGRKGSVVDNAGHGGIFAVFDAESGIITTDGVDEHGGRFERHPDSGLKFKGWQVPYYEELKKLVSEVHQSLPSHHRYVGFDFALTDKGWVLVEGNWGQMVGQMAELKGIRRKFIEYIS